MKKKTECRRGKRRWRAIIVLGLLCALAFAGRNSIVGLVASHIETPMQRADYRAVEFWLRIADFLGPSNPEAAFIRARLNRHLGRQQQFLESLAEAQDLGFSPKRIIVEQKLNRAMGGDLDPLQQQMPELLADGTDAGEVCEACVLGCLMAYRLADASAVLQVWLADFPNASKARFLHGRLLEHRESLNEAAREYRLASDLGHGPSAFALAGVLAEQHELEAAVVQAKRAQDLLYDPQPGNVRLARLHRMLGDLDAAEKYLALATESAPEPASIAWRTAGIPASDAVSEVDAERAEIQLARKDYPAAESSFRVALEKSPRRWRLRNGLATALRLQGKLDEAAEHLERFAEVSRALDECGSLIDQLRVDPGNLEARVRVAETFLNHISERQGLVWLRSVLQYDPGHQEANRLLSRFYREHASENPAYSQLAEQHEQQLYGQAASNR